MTRILVAGAGIAGLTAALALRHHGLDDVTVFEQAAEIRPLGSGLNLMPQATAQLAELGLLDELREVAIATSTMHLATDRGPVLWSEKRGLGQWPQLSIHRGWLTDVLAKQVAARFGPEALVPDARLTSLDPIRRIATFTCADGSELSEEFDVFVGADGIRSVARRAVSGEPGTLQYAGATVWRGVTRYSTFADGASMVIAGDGRCKVVFYPLKDYGDGTCLMNWAAATPTDGDPGPQGNWNTSARPEQFATSFAGWEVCGIDVEQMMEATELPFAYPMVDIDPLPRWSVDTTTLIGDAAHAMYPIGSNGATQSVIDAAVLAGHLGNGGSPADRISAYERERRPATTAVQVANRARGPEVVIDLAAQRAPHGFSELSDVFAPGELEQIAARYASISGAPVPVRNA